MIRGNFKDYNTQIAGNSIKQNSLLAVDSSHRLLNDTLCTHCYSGKKLQIWSCILTKKKQYLPC